MKAIIYARESSKDQERDGFSIPAQKKLLREYAAKNALTGVEVFKEAETAKRAGRKQCDRMLDFVRDNADVRDILVEKTDRLYRNFKDFSRLDIDQLGIRVHLVKEGEVLSRDSRSHQKFIHGIKVLMAKNYSDNLSEEVRKGLDDKAAQGVWPSAAPIGDLNRLDDHTIVVDLKTAGLIRCGFEIVATPSWTSLSPAKKELGKEAMACVLRNPIYFGEFIWKGKRFCRTHDPIVDCGLVDRTEEAMGFAQKPRLTKRDFDYAGVMTCNHCGCAVTAEAKCKKSGKRYVYYHCTRGRGACEHVTYLREELIEEAFVAALSKA